MQKYLCHSACNFRVVVKVKIGDHMYLSTRWKPCVAVSEGLSQQQQQQQKSLSGETDSLRINMTVTLDPDSTFF